MKILKCFGNLEFLLEDDEAKNVERMWFETPDKPIKLRCGAVVNPKSFIAITDPDEIPYWDAYPLNKDGKSFNRDGQRINLSPEGMEEVKYKPHPKYLALREKLLQKTKMLTDRQRTEISEETASEERRNK